MGHFRFYIVFTNVHFFAFFLAPVRPYISVRADPKSQKGPSLQLLCFGVAVVFFSLLHLMSKSVYILCFIFQNSRFFGNSTWDFIGGDRVCFQVACRRQNGHGCNTMVRTPEGMPCGNGKVDTFLEIKETRGRVLAMSGRC